MLQSKLSKWALAMFAVAGIAVVAGTALGDPDIPEVKKIAELVKGVRNRRRSAPAVEPRLSEL